jgi:hypothetical protein
LTDDDRWRTMREGALARAKKFSADKIVPLYEELYARVAG